MYKTRLDELIEGAYHALKTGGKTIVRIIPNGQSTDKVVEGLHLAGLPLYIAADNDSVRNATGQTTRQAQPVEYEINLKEIELDQFADTSEEYGRLKRLYKQGISRYK